MVISQTTSVSATSQTSVTGRSSSGLAGVFHKGSCAGTSSSHSPKSGVHKEQHHRKNTHLKNSPQQQHYAGGVWSPSVVANNKISPASPPSQPTRRPASSPSVGRHELSDCSSGIQSLSTATLKSRTNSNQTESLRSQYPIRPHQNNPEAQNINPNTSKNIISTNINEDQTKILSSNQYNCRNQFQRSNSERPSPFSQRQEEESVHSPKLPGGQCQYITHKYPLTRKISNITVDSGRSSTSGTDDCIFDEEDEDFVDTAAPNRVSSLTSAADTVTSRRHSIACVDSTGHLDVPAYPCLDSAGDPRFHPLLGGASPGSNQRHLSRDSNDAGNSPDDALNDIDKEYESSLSPPATLSGASPNSSSAPVNVLSVRRAPKIVYSHSEDRLTASCNGQQRPIIPSLPYSPYGSPTASPRLRRQPTMETHRVSVSEGTGSYTQLNQYTLQDEIGKVSATSL